MGKKLEIKTIDGKLLHIIEEEDLEKPLVITLEIETDKKKITDTKYLRITSNHNRLVLN